MNALDLALDSLKAFEVVSSDGTLGLITINVKGGGVGYGENMSITVSEINDSSSQVTVISGPKVPYLLWRSKSEKSINAVLTEFSGQLSKIKILTPDSFTGQGSPSSATTIEERLNKLSDLLSQGLISEDEYQQKRKEILDAL